MKLGKLFQKQMIWGKLVIDLGSIIWDNVQPPLLTPGSFPNSELIEPNKLLIKIEDEVYLFYYSKFKLHGKKLFMGYAF